MKARKKKLSWLLSLLAVICMILGSSLTAFAADGDNGLMATEDPRESILLMTLGYEDDNGEYIPYKGGTSFLINDEYVLTNKHVVTVTEEELQEIRQIVGKPDLQPNDSHIKLKLYVNRDMKVTATMHESVNSSDMDFAAVRLAEKIYDRHPIALGDSAALKERDAVYALGFPDDSINGKEYNTKNDVSTVDGTVSKLTQTGSMDIVEHTAQLSNGNSGGPLLDANNKVVGINRFVIGGKSYSVQINVIKEALDTFGIPYISDPITPPGPDPRDDLESAINSAKNRNAAEYTEESYAALDASLKNAEEILANTSATDEEVEMATSELTQAINALVTKPVEPVEIKEEETIVSPESESGPKLNIIMIGIIAAVVIIVLIIIVLLVTRKKPAAQTAGYTEQPKPYQPGPSPSAVPTSGPAAGGGYTSAPPTVPEGAGETTLLDAGAGETTLLSSGGTAYLIRKKNGEKIAINVQNFKIGKERRKVNYCVSDNTSVSREHCEIVRKGGDYYVTDLGATNFTFVNGVQLSPRRETLLSDQSILKLSDEEFEFHLS